MKEEIQAAEKMALKVIEDSNWDAAKKMMYNKIITDAAWSTNGSSDKLQDITETTFRLAFMDVTRDKEIDEIKEIVKGTSEDVKSLIKRMDDNDKLTKELKESFDGIKTKSESQSAQKTKFQAFLDAIVALGWKGVIWAAVIISAIFSMAYRLELMSFFGKMF